MGNKLLGLILSSLILCTSQIYGSSCSSKPKEEQANEYLQTHRFQQTKAHEPRDIEGVISPIIPKTASMDVDGVGLIFTGSYLYWQARQEGLELGFTNPTLANPPQNKVANIGGEVIDFHFRYKMGFKTGIGYNLDSDGWGVLGEYTYFRSITTTETIAPQPGPNGFIISPWISPANGINVLATSGRWKLDLDIVDFQFGRTYYFGKLLKLRNFGGIRFIHLDQNYFVENQALTGTVFNATDLTTSYGIGPRLGFNSDWMISERFRFISNFAASFPFTKYNWKIKEQSAVTPTSLINNISGRIYYTSVQTDFSLGFGWGSYMPNKSAHLDFVIAYEYQVFWNQNYIRLYNDLLNTTSAGVAGSGHTTNLYVHGITGSFRVDF